MKKLILILTVFLSTFVYGQNKTFHGTLKVKDIPSFAVTDSLLTVDADGLFKFRPVSSVILEASGGVNLLPLDNDWLGNNTFLSLSMVGTDPIFFVGDGSQGSRAFMSHSSIGFYGCIGIL